MDRLMGRHVEPAELKIGDHPSFRGGIGWCRLLSYLFRRIVLLFQIRLDAYPLLLIGSPFLITDHT